MWRLERDSPRSHGHGTRHEDGTWRLADLDLAKVVYHPMPVPVGGRGVFWPGDERRLQSGGVGGVEFGRDVAEKENLLRREGHVGRDLRVTLVRALRAGRRVEVPLEEGQ